MLEIRNAVLDDLDAITSVFVQCFNDAPWNDGWSFAAARERLVGAGSMRSDSTYKRCVSFQTASGAELAARYSTTSRNSFEGKGLKRST